MELIIFLIIYALSSVFVITVSYYKRLFSGDRDEFKRDELTGVRYIMETEWKVFFNTGEKPIVYYAFAIAAFVGLLVSYMGGLYGAHYEDLFFHSAILSVALFFLLPKSRESLVGESTGALFWQKLLHSDSALFVGFTLSIVAKTIMVYFKFHALSFLWVFLNTAVMFILILLRIWIDEGVISGPMDILKGRRKKDKKQ
ncbi:MAG: hypothetical protein ABUK01_16530 [Leptospirales bacterium]